MSPILGIGWQGIKFLVADRGEHHLGGWSSQIFHENIDDFVRDVAQLHDPGKFAHLKHPSRPEANPLIVS